MPKYTDALRGYAFPVHQRDNFICRYCGLDGKASFANWLSLSWDHLLPKGNPERTCLDFIVTACMFCNTADNRYFDNAAKRGLTFDGLTPEQLIAQRLPYVEATRNAYHEFWNGNVRDHSDSQHPALRSSTHDSINGPSAVARDGTIGSSRPLPHPEQIASELTSINSGPQMSIAVSVDRNRIAEFCRRWKIRELALFGSVLRPDFRSDSDVDVLVTFDADADWGLWDHAAMQDELAGIFGRNVDLVTRRAVERSENWIRRQAILESAEPIHVEG